jgi:hypothetical protein
VRVEVERETLNCSAVAVHLALGVEAESGPVQARYHNESIDEMGLPYIAENFARWGRIRPEVKF